MNMPTIYLVDKATAPLGVELAALLAALQKQVDRDFAPAWGLSCKLALAPRPIDGAWNLILADDADAPGALGYHELTRAGAPVGFVFVRTTIAAKELPSVTASHELLEMLPDAWINLWADDGSGTLRAYESADGVEESTYAIDGVAVSNFVYPEWFEGFRRPRSTRFDHLGLCSRPFQLLKGGYATILRGGRVSQVFGSKEKARRFAREDRRWHRSEFRGKRR